MKTITKADLDKLVKTDGLETFTADQLKSFSQESYNQIEKSLTGKEKEKALSDVLKEVKSFTPYLVWGDDLTKSIMFVRPQQVKWDEPTDDISKARTGTFLNTPENRLLGRVGQRYIQSDDIEKGKPANAGEIRVWSGKKMRKQPNGKWVEVSEHGMTKKEHQSKSEYYHGKASGKVDSNTTNRGDKGAKMDFEAYKHHQEQYSKLSDKEYDESELSENSKEQGSSFKDSAKYSGSDFSKWKEAVKGNHDIEVVKDGDLSLIYTSGNKHIGTYNHKDGVMMADDMKIFGNDVKNK